MSVERKQNLATAEFRLFLRDSAGVRVAVLDSSAHTLVWEDDGSRVFPPGSAEGPAAAGSPRPAAAFAVAPHNPGLKSREPRVVKIQLGLGCNMSCEYCSQREIRPDRTDAEKTLEKVRTFLSRIDEWFRGGPAGDGEGTRIELWGGETLIYWKAMSLIGETLRARHPKALIHFFTNGTLLTPGIIDEVERLGMHVTVSHDGPFTARTRGRDVFADPRTAAQVRELFRRLNPGGRISFNATITRESPDLLAIHHHIADALGAPFESVRVTHEIGIPYESDSVALFGDASLAIRTGLVRAAVAGGVHGLLACGLWEHVEEVRGLFGNPVDRNVFGQRCGMDRSDRIAVDLDGNVLTCQITSAESGHRIGAIERLEDVRLTTSRHWSEREECGSCPVLLSCRGGCMFMTGKSWTDSCDQLFDWHLGYLATALYLQTGRVLEKVEGGVIRGKGGDGAIAVEVLRAKDFIDLLAAGSAPQVRS